MDRLGRDKLLVTYNDPQRAAKPDYHFHFPLLASLSVLFAECLDSCHLYVFVVVMPLFDFVSSSFIGWHRSVVRVAIQ